MSYKALFKYTMSAQALEAERKRGAKASDEAEAALEAERAARKQAAAATERRLQAAALYPPSHTFFRRLMVALTPLVVACHP